jgi:hypothetical protein
MVLPIFAYLLVPIALVNFLFLHSPDRFQSPKIFRMLILYPTAFILGWFGTLGFAGSAVSFLFSGAIYRTKQSYSQCVGVDKWGWTGINSLPDWLLSDWILEYFQNFPYCHGNGTVSWEFFFLVFNSVVFFALPAPGVIAFWEYWEDRDGERL